MRLATPRTSSAFSLTEVCLALAVTAFCLLAIFGLLPVGISSSQTAIEQTTANRILSMVAADMRATRPPTIQEATSMTPIITQQFRIGLPSGGASSSPMTLYFTPEGNLVADGNGDPVSSPTADSRFRVALKFPGNASPRAATLASLTISWPATIPLENATGSVKTFVAIDRN